MEEVQQEVMVDAVVAVLLVVVVPNWVVCCL